MVGESVVGDSGKGWVMDDSVRKVEVVVVGEKNFVRDYEGGVRCV